MTDKSIETHGLDSYVQGVLRNRDLTSDERARSATGAIAVEVMRDANLPLTTRLEVPVESIREAFDRVAEHFALRCRSVVRPDLSGS